MVTQCLLTCTTAKREGKLVHPFLGAPTTGMSPPHCSLPLFLHLSLVWSLAQRRDGSGNCADHDYSGTEGLSSAGSASGFSWGGPPPPPVIWRDLYLPVMPEVRHEWKKEGRLLRVKDKGSRLPPALPVGKRARSKGGGTPTPPKAYATGDQREPCCEPSRKPWVVSSETPLLTRICQPSTAGSLRVPCGPLSRSSSVSLAAPDPQHGPGALSFSSFLPPVCCPLCPSHAAHDRAWLTPQSLNSSFFRLHPPSRTNGDRPCESPGPCLPSPQPHGGNCFQTLKRETPTHPAPSDSVLSASTLRAPWSAQSL